MVFSGGGNLNSTRANVYGVFFDSFFNAITYAYPNKFKHWHFVRGMIGIWDGEEGKRHSLEAIKEMLERLKIPFEELPRKVIFQTFKAYGFGGMLQALYNSSSFEALNALFLGVFKPWEFALRNYWEQQPIETAREATYWLVEEKLGLSAEMIGTEVRQEHFVSFGFVPMLDHFYYGSVFKALDDAYPSKETD